MILAVHRGETDGRRHPLRSPALPGNRRHGPRRDRARHGRFRGRAVQPDAGYERYRREFAKLIWHTASPKWNFDDATFNRSARSFDNPDHVAIVIHNYRWRLGLADGDKKYSELDSRLAAGPAITVPTITLEGDANGAPHPDPSAVPERFNGARRRSRSCKSTG